jgi:transposase
MLTRGEEYVDQGRERYEEQQRKRSISALKRRAAALGFQVAPIAAGVRAGFEVVSREASL